MLYLKQGQKEVKFANSELNILLRETFTMKIGSAALFIHLSLKLLEGLLGGRGLQNLEGIEANSLGQGSAFTDNDGIPDRDVSEAWRHVNGKVLVPLLKTVVFLDVMQVITPDNNSPGHLHLYDDASQDTTSDGDLNEKFSYLK